MFIYIVHIQDVNTTMAIIKDDLESLSTQETAKYKIQINEFRKIGITKHYGTSKAGEISFGGGG